MKHQQIDYTVQIWKEGVQYIAHATPIDVMSSGASPEQARIAVTEAVHLFIKTAREMGTLEDILDECGYIFEKDEWISPMWIAIEKHFLAVGAS